MPVTDITKDIENRRLTISAEFAAPVERVWGLYADPRQLERVWGPPSHPATFVDHSLTVGSRCTYFMTGPDGEKFAGWWRITAVDRPNSAEALQQVLDMGVEEGATAAINQIDAYLAGAAV